MVMTSRNDVISYLLVLSDGDLLDILQGVFAGRTPNPEEAAYSRNAYFLGIASQMREDDLELDADPQLHRWGDLERALPGLLAFAAPLDGVQQEARALLGPHPTDLLALRPETWRPVATLIFAAWEATVRASSAVENWHSVLRPHLAVQRTLPPGLLALLTVWHNHQISPRGLHQGQSPLQRSGLPPPRPIG